ncbi:hypothetical protein [Pseudonocardia ammonioxydans]|uniref:hypothetical protein n=1 Tax=Pseudonocardia ammonioxydans TaxID=260086 RepID=UPI000B834593|nr:hypothetical protein [Pseudonocardia ammonioxydans]
MTGEIGPNRIDGVPRLSGLLEDRFRCVGARSTAPHRLVTVIVDLLRGWQMFVCVRRLHIDLVLTAGATCRR